MVAKTGNLPLSTELARNGIKRVAAFNDISVVLNAVPLRDVGEVRDLIINYAQASVAGFFHRYASATQVGSFSDETSADAAISSAEDDIRRHPAPGVKFGQPVTSLSQPAFVFAFTVMPLGHIRTHWDPISRSVINQTQPDHQMSDGFVVRQVSRVEQSIYVVTYGEGDNTDPARSYANGTYGPDGFRAMDQHVFSHLKSHTGFLSQSLPRPNGTGSAYQGAG